MVERLIPFEKYEGAGNDFIIFDFFEFEHIDLLDVRLMEKLCDRRFGIGSDGIIAVKPNEHFDFEMLYLNADGNFSTFCGNGSRCAVTYVAKKLDKTALNFVAADGPHTGYIIEADLVKVKMKDLKPLEETEYGSFVDTGSPHLVIETLDLLNCDVNNEGRRLRQAYSKEGSNVNFVSFGESLINIRTYERGVEAETYACGTGIIASAYTYCIKKNMKAQQKISVKAQGGDLSVEMNITEYGAIDVYLIGPAKHVFSGFIPIDKV